jgi:hypothetical protein
VPDPTYGQMKQQLRLTIRFLVLVSTTYAACSLSRFANAQTAKEDSRGGSIEGTVYAVESDGARSAIPGALVRLVGPSSSQQTVTSGEGGYSFSALDANTYEIDVTAPGLRGSKTIALGNGEALEIPIELSLETVKESVTVTGSAEPTSSAYSSDQSVLDRSTVLNAPNQHDRVDALLPLIPGVVRGPDGLINMKGARSSQGGFLVNSANVTDPVTGNTTMDLPIDVVESVKVIANPYDPEYGRLTGAVSSVDTVTGNFDTFHASVQNLFVRPRQREGNFIGIESATPRITLTGPIVKKKIAFTQSFEYRFIRTPVSSLP